MNYLLHDVFIETVKKHPHQIAIKYSNQTITYSKLNELANQFSHFFSRLKENIKKTPFIGIFSPVHIQSIAAVLGALKIGCTYVPLDQQSPIDRLEAIINNCKLDVIVIDPAYYNLIKPLLINSHIKNCIFITKSDHDIQEPNIHPYSSVLKHSNSELPRLNQVSADLAYILHSSGSTGVPKGIMLTHQNARTFIDWMHKEFAVEPNDIIISRAPFNFDLSIFDIFNTFKAGATLICYDWNKGEKGEKQHQSYVDLMIEEKVTILYTTPSTFISLMNRGKLLEKSQDLTLSRIMYAGEPFPVTQLRKLQKALPQTKIANIYGPTETNIITYYWLPLLLNDDPIPLGVEVDDTEIIVVNEEGSHICLANEVGEIWCRGGTVTLGYLGMEEKTKQCKVLSPFHSYPAEFWKTGDYGYRDEKGILYYRGRKDHMIKVKGYRIEIGEIESALSQYVGLDEFAVVAKSDEKLGNILYFFYSPLKNYQVDVNALKEFLMTKIPKYMLPSEFIKKPVLPKTSTGKIDRVLLASLIL